jgi:hypothetical protein
MIDKATEIVSKAEQKVQATTFGAAEIISLGLAAGGAGAVVVTLLLMVAII